MWIGKAVLVTTSLWMERICMATRIHRIERGAWRGNSEEKRNKRDTGRGRWIGLGEGEGRWNMRGAGKASRETLDGRTDGADVYVAETSFSVGKSSSQNGIQVASERTSGAAGLGEGYPKCERSDEKYCDDIFGETPVGVRKLGKGEVLGLTYDHPMDMWSVGCCLYELYTGKVLFPGSTNNDMLRLHMELKSPFPKKMLKKGAFVDEHFDHDLNFHAIEEDPVTKKIMKKIIVNIKPKDIGSIISGSPGEDPKMFVNFKDLLEKVFVLDPEKRMTVYQALAHSFITGK